MSAFRRLSELVAAAVGSPLGLVTIVVTSGLSWWLLGWERTLMWVSLLALWLLFPLQASSNTLQASQHQDTAEIKAAVRELVRAEPRADERVLSEGDGGGGELERLREVERKTAPWLAFLEAIERETGRFPQPPTRDT